MTSVYCHGASSSSPQEEMLRTAQAQSEEEQLRNAIEASCHTESAAAAEEELVRQAIAESIASTSGLNGDAGAVDGVPAATASGEEVFGTVATDEEEDLRRALLLSGMSEEWEAPPDSVAGVNPGINLAELQEETELRRAIDASLADE